MIVLPLPRAGCRQHSGCVDHMGDGEPLRPAATVELSEPAMWHTGTERDR